MGNTDTVQPQGDKIRKAVRWISETLREHPEKSRVKVVKEAEIRFDLTPRECTFLDQDSQEK
ncbi:MAG: hypothetical protein HGA96_17090 [Desulfobulbaceae bacterium]|nr:hypothetical protein [Desulfobulbaceae bacterium]